jgi:hypothetical protein
MHRGMAQPAGDAARILCGQKLELSADSFRENGATVTALMLPV